MNPKLSAEPIICFLLQGRGLDQGASLEAACGVQPRASTECIHISLASLPLGKCCTTVLLVYPRAAQQLQLYFPTVAAFTAYLAVIKSRHTIRAVDQCHGLPEPLPTREKWQHAASGKDPGCIIHSFNNFVHAELSGHLHFFTAVFQTILL